MSDLPFLTAQSLLQDTHLDPDPSLTPSTSADKKPRLYRRSPEDSFDSDLDSEPDSDSDSDSDSSDRGHGRGRSDFSSAGRKKKKKPASLTSSLLSFPASRGRRRPTLPPLPDLRFEQSYLASVSVAEGVWWKVGLITFKDQVVFPLVQGFGYNLLVRGWRVFNSRARFSGEGVGAKVRRWWWRVNGWRVPEGGSSR